MWLRTLVRSCLAAGVGSLLDLDLGNPDWTPQPAAVNRIVQRHARRRHRRSTSTRRDTRDLGYIDTNYWGFRFPDRRSPFDLTGDLAAVAAGHHLGLPGRPAGRAEPAPRPPVRSSRPAASLVCFSAYLHERDPSGGATAGNTDRATAR